MKIDPSIKGVSTNPTAATAASPLRVLSRQDEVNIQQSEGLSQALANLPAVRPSVVAEARALINDVHYPPLAVIDSISHLIAARLKLPAGK